MPYYRPKTKPFYAIQWFTGDTVAGVIIDSQKMGGEPHIMGSWGRRYVIKSGDYLGINPVTSLADYVYKKKDFEENFEEITDGSI